MTPLLSFRVRAGEVGPDNHARVLALCDYLQEAAAYDADRRGFAWPEIPGGQGGWVMQRLRLEIAARPKWDTEVHVATWPSTHDGLRAHREFVMTTDDGAEVARGTSTWFLVDIARRRPVRIPPAVAGVHLENEGVALPHDAPPTPDLGTAAAACRFSVRRSDLDPNGHANHVRYIEWAAEAVPDDVAAREFAGVDVTFKAEAVYGDVVVSAVSAPEADGDEVLVRHRLVREADGRELARLLTRWR